MKVFLGYASEHVEIAKKVLGILREKGDLVWFDKDSLIGGDRWDVERLVAQREANLVVHLCSIEILKRPGVVNREIRDSLENDRDRPFGTTYLVPIKIGDFQMPSELEDKQWIHIDDSKFAEKLTASLEKRRRQLSIQEDVRIKEIDVKHTNAVELPEEVLRMPLTRGSQRIEIADHSTEFECSCEYLSFDGKGTYWQFVNGSIAELVLKAYYGTRSDFLTENENSAVSLGTKSFWSLATEEFYRSEELVSVRFYESSYYAGAAHPNHGVRTLNFAGSRVGKLEIGRLIGHSFEGAQALLNYCERIVMAGFSVDNPSDCSFFEDYRDNIDDVFKLLAQFNFDRRGVTFNFSPYEVLPYACGTHEAFVPWNIVFENAEYHSEKERELLEQIAVSHWQ